MKKQGYYCYYYNCHYNCYSQQVYLVVVTEDQVTARFLDIPISLFLLILL